MAFLILRLSTDGRDTLATFARRAPIGDARLQEVQSLAARNGIEVHGHGPVSRAAWPLRVVAYKSRSSRERPAKMKQHRPLV